MGYTTYFKGSIDIKPTDELMNFVNNLSESECERSQYFWFVGKRVGLEVVHNSGFRTPEYAVYMDWIISQNRKCLKWNGMEKFYGYVEYLQLLLDAIFIPLGYVLNGKIYYQGEDSPMSVSWLYGTIILKHKKFKPDSDNEWQYKKNTKTKKKKKNGRNNKFIK